jgi:hypothetical protein
MTENPEQATRDPDPVKEPFSGGPDLTHRPDPYGGDPAHFPRDRADAKVTFRPNPYGGDPTRFPHDRADAEVTFRPDPYAGPPGHNSDERWIKSRSA